MFDIQYFAKMLQKYRKERGITQNELAKLLFVTPQSVSRWECAEAMPDIAHLCELSRLLCVSIDVLVDNHRPESRTYIGIDGGGTKTEFALIDESGRKLNTIVLEGCNPNTCGVKQTVSIVRRGIDFLRPGEMNVAAIFFGGAGLGTGSNADTIRTELERAYPGIKIGCDTDIRNVIACCSQPDNCLAAICGTGCVVFGYSEGTLHRTGGLGYRFEHSGSGFELGRDAITAALCHLDGTGEETVLTRLVEEKLGGGVWDAIHDLYQKDNAYIASFAPLVIRAAEDGDKVAEAILEESCEHMVRLIRAASKKTPGARTIILSGSLFAKSEGFFRRVTERLPEHLAVERISCPPVWGACLQAAKLCKPVQMPLLDNFLKE